MDFGRLRAKFENRLDFLDGRFYQFMSSRPARLGFEEWMVLEGIVSATWQYWGHCCRNILIFSSLGARTEAGIQLAPSSKVNPLQWERVSYLAIKACKGGAVQAGKLNSTLRLEPTWGDIDRIQDIAQVIAPANLSQLASAFGVATRIKDIQTVRNAAAHRNRETLQDVLRLAPRYVASSIRHPAEATLWEDPTTKSFAYLSWTEEMRDAVKLAVA